MATMKVFETASRLLLMSVFFLVLIKLAKACSCAPSQYQTRYCSADLVIKGTIKSTEFIYAEAAITNNEVYGSSSWQANSFSELVLPIRPFQQPLFVLYNVTIKDIFKGEGMVSATKTLRVSSAGSESLCGITHLQEEETYVMSGFLWDGEMHIGLCSSWVEPYKGLTGFQRRALRRHYGMSCGECKVCSHYDPEECDTSNSCWDTLQSSCAMENTICMRKPNGKCAWKKNKYVKRC